MSWAKEEWKQDLPSKTLQNIYQLENELENLRKHKQQQELKIDGYVSALEKQRKEFADEKGLNAVLQRDYQEMSRKFANLETKSEKLTSEIKNKDTKLELGEEALQKVQQKLKAESAKAVELQNTLEQKQKEVNDNWERSQKLEAEVEKFKQGKDHLFKENRASSDKISSLTKEIELLRQSTSTENANEVIVEEPEVADNEKEEGETEIKEKESRENSNDAFVEIMKRENNGLITENEDLKIQRDQLKHMVDEKTKEIERNMAKAACVKVELQNTQRALKDAEEKITSLEKLLDNRDGKVRDLQDQLRMIEKDKQKIKEELECLKYNTEATKASKGQVLKEFEERMKEIGILESDLKKTKRILNEKQEQLVSLETQNQQLASDIDGLREQVRTSREAANSATNELKKKEQRLKTLDEEQHFTEDKEKTRLEKLEVLLIQNESLKQQVEEMETDRKESQWAYESVIQALDSSRNTIQTLELKMKELLPSDADQTPSQAPTPNVTETGTQYQEPSMDHVAEKVCVTTQTIVDGDLVARLQARIQEIEEDKATVEGSAEDLIAQLQAQIRDLQEDKCSLEGSAREQDQIVEELITQLEDVKNKDTSRGEGDMEMIDEMEVELDESTEEENMNDNRKEDVEEKSCEGEDRKVLDGNAERKNKASPGKSTEEGDELHFPKQWYSLCANVQKDHEILKCGVEECCNTSHLVEESLALEEKRQEGNCCHDLKPVTQSIRYLMNQLLALKMVLQRCEDGAERRHDSNTGGDNEESDSVQDSVQDHDSQDGKDDNIPNLHDNTDNKNEKGGAPREESEEARKGCEGLGTVSDGDLRNGTPRRDLSWDNFESEKAFQVFRRDVNSIVKQLNREEQHEGTHRPREKVEEHGMMTSGNDDAVFRQTAADMAHALKNLLAENNDVICGRMEAQFEQFSESLKRQLVRNESPSDRQASKGNEVSPKTEGEDYDNADGIDTRSIMDGKYAMDEIEIMKRKMQEIKKSIKQLISASAMAEKKRIAAHSHLDLLQDELKEKESHFEMRCGELENTVRTASQQEIVLQRQVNNLRSEKDDMNCDLREVLQTLKEKEMELVKTSQQVKNLQAENFDKEAKLKSKIEALQQENEMMWEDYTEASRNAGEKETEFKRVMDQLKCTELSVMNLFATMGNINDHLQQAKGHMSEV